MPSPPPPLPTAPDPMVGKLLGGQYLVDQLVAKGGMGNIYLAHQQRLGRAYAIKTLRPEYCEDAKVVKRFFREALAVSQLRHPHTVQVFDSGETTDGIQYIVMEYLEGESLDRTLANLGCLDPESALTFAGQAAAALAEAHKKGIVHRDLKPANIFIVRAENVPDFIKILDFGIAKFYLGSEGSIELTKLTSAGSTMGTPHYMAPEQIRGEDVDGRADIYSLGIILWESLVGTTPFQGDSPMEVFLGHLEQELPPISTVAPAVPPGFDGVVKRALAKDVRERFQSMAEFKIALDSFRSGDHVGLNVSQRIVLGEGIPAEMPTLPEGSMRALSPRRRAVILALVAGAALALVGFIAALVIITSGETPSATSSETKTETPQPPPPALSIAYVKVFSVPEGASVSMDGRPVGYAPVQVQRADATPFSIALKAPEHRSIALDLTPVVGQVRGVVIALPRLGGDLIAEEEAMAMRVESDPPGADIRIDGEPTGFVTPFSLQMDASRGRPIELSIVRAGYVTENYAVVPRPGVSATITTTLIRVGMAP